MAAKANVVAATKFGRPVWVDDFLQEFAEQAFTAPLFALYRHQSMTFSGKVMSTPAE